MMSAATHSFFDMGGYGFYIWAAYGVSALALIGLTVFIRRRFKKTKSKLDAKSQD